MGKDLKGKELGQGLSQRKDGRYMYRNGKDNVKYFNKLSEAKKYKRDHDYEKAHGIYSTSGETTLNEWFDFWIDNVKIHDNKETTIQAKKSLYKKAFRDEIGFMKMCDITPIICQRLINKLLDNYKSSTINQMFIVLQSMYKDAQNFGKDVKNPINSTVKYGKDSKIERIALSVEQQEIVLEECKNIKYKNILTLGFETGMRIGEILALKTSDIDFNKNIIRVNKTLVFVKGVKITTPKSSSSVRTIPMTPTVKQLLRNITIGEENDIIFRTESGKYILTKSVNYHLEKLTEKIREKHPDFPHLHTHIARHTFATRCVEKGIQPKVLQTILGHASISTTMKYYVHINDDFLQTEFKKFSMTQNACVKSVSNEKNCG